jgi:hypothetical protein
MAWIKMRTDLHRDPAVIQLSEKFGWQEHVIVGLLHKIWSWADEQLIDGNACGVTKAFLDRYINVDGFADALVHVGWLQANAQGLHFPNFEVHMSETAKKRATTAKRVQKSRNASSVTKALPEKEKSKSKSKSKSKKKNENTTECARVHSLHSKEFENFWKFSWNKKGKAMAAKAYATAFLREHASRLGSKPDEIHAYLVDRAQAFAASPDARPRDRSPIMVSTWLNQSRYADDPESWRNNGDRHQFSNSNEEIPF